MTNLQKNFLKNFQKPIDKLGCLCYTLITVREEPTGRKRKRRMNNADSRDVS